MVLCESTHLGAVVEVASTREQVLLLCHGGTRVEGERVEGPTMEVKNRDFFYFCHPSHDEIVLTCFLDVDFCSLKNRGSHWVLRCGVDADLASI